MNGFKRVTENYDFIVVGGGVTGLCAAISAARHGAKTALVQDRPVLGGNASSEIRMHIYGASAMRKKPELTEGGIIHELMLENKHKNDSYNFSIWDAVLFSAAKKQENLTLYLNTTMHSVNLDGKKIKSIECYQMTTERQLILSADIFADCTGNGTLCAFAGSSFCTGSEAKSEYNEPHAPDKADKNRMGNTILFKAADVGHPVKFTAPVDAMHFTEDQLKYRRHTAIQKEILEKASDNEMIMLFDGFAQDYGYWWIELSGEKDDIIEEYEDIRDQLVRAVYGVWDHIKNGGDHGAENYELVWVGMLPGMRESRRIICDYMLNENDVMSNRRFKDTVAYGGWDIDNHVPGGLLAYDKLPSTVYPFEGSYDIPYRAYCVKDFDNLFAGGRCMGTSKLAMASTRVMGTCAIGGQAIGTAAAISIKNSHTIREIDINKLQQTLLRDDCYLPEIYNTDELDLARNAEVSASSQQSEFPANNVVSGETRQINGASNQWRSEGISREGEWLSLKLSKSASVREVQIIFDSNFDIPKNITLSSRRQKQQEVGVPKELVKDFDIELVKDGNVVAKKQIRGNYQRLFRACFEGVDCDKIKIVALNTNGCPDARIFEVRIYE